MTEFMSQEECTEKYLRKVTPDPEKAFSIIDIAKDRKAFVDSLTLNANTVSFILENQYEIVKELLIAILLTKGLKSDNHQCLITYFYRHFPYEKEAHLIRQMNSLRNKLDYYGKKVELEYYKSHQQDIKETITLLFKIAQNQVNR